MKLVSDTTFPLIEGEGVLYGEVFRIRDRRFVELLEKEYFCKLCFPKLIGESIRSWYLNINKDSHKMEVDEGHWGFNVRAVCQ